MSCIIKSVTLAAGESYVLPPGAELIAASNTNLITVSPVECTPTDNLETFTCYIFAMVGHANNQYVGSAAWTDETSRINEFHVGGVINPIDVHMNSKGVWDVLALRSWMITNPAVSGLFLDITTSAGSSEYLLANSGGVSTLCFKTIPSVASSMYLSVRSSQPGINVGGTGTGQTKDWRIYPVPLSQYIGANACICTII